MSHNDLTEYELGKNFTVAVGGHYRVGELSTAIGLSGKNVRLFTPETKPEYPCEGYNPMRVNIHMGWDRKITRIHFG